jgi:hypothetical protein
MKAVRLRTIRQSSANQAIYWQAQGNLRSNGTSTIGSYWGHVDPQVRDLYTMKSNGLGSTTMAYHRFHGTTHASYVYLTPMDQECT